MTISTETKNYIDDNIRKSTDSSIQAITNNLGNLDKNFNDMRVTLRGMKITGENTLAQATKTNGRVDKAEEDLKLATKERSDLELHLAVADQQHKLIKVVATFVGVIALVQMASILFGVPTDQLFRVILELI